MRIISRQTLIRFWERFPDAEQPLKAWFDDVKKMKWLSPNLLKAAYQSASIIDNKRVVFNVKGNNYRLVVDIEYKLCIVFIVWIGTHKQYDKLDIRKLQYDKSNKK